jgi:hypothetical protein
MSQPPYQPYPQEPSSGGGFPPPQPPGYGQQPPVYGQQPPAYGQQPGYSAPPPPDSFPPPQSGFPPPQSGFPPPGGAPPPKKKSSALKIVLIVVAVIAVLCVGGVAVSLFVAKDKVSEVVDAAKISVVEPQTLGGRPKVTDPAMAGSVSALDSELSKVPGATGSVGALYGNPEKQDLVMVAAASSITGSAQSKYDDFTSGMGSSGFDVSGLKDTDPGPLGGIAKCGDGTTAGVPMAVCVWSDNGSIGMVAMLFKKAADLQKEFVSMRGQIEKKA